MIDERLAALVDRLSEPAFQDCVHRLWPRLSYQVLTETDVRPIDLKEWLCGYFWPHMQKKKGPDLFDRYIEAMRYYFESCFDCAPGSPAEKFYRRAMKTWDKPNHKWDFDDFESLCAVLIPLTRSASKEAKRQEKNKDKKRRPLAEFEFKISSKDFKTLERVAELKPIDKSLLKHPKEAVVPILSKIKRLSDEQTCIINTLLLCRMLQIQGEYTEREE